MYKFFLYIIILLCLSKLFPPPPPLPQVEGVLDEEDFQLPLKREEFEDMCADIFERVRAPIDAALISAGMDITSIDQVCVYVYVFLCVCVVGGCCTCVYTGGCRHGYYAHRPVIYVCGYL